MPDTTNFITALGRTATLLAQIHDCMTQKYDSDNSYSPNTGKYNAFKAGYIALLNQITTGVTQESFSAAVDQHVASPLEDLIATDGLPCSSNDIIVNVKDPFSGNLEPILQPNP